MSKDAISLIKQAIPLSEYIARFSESVKPSGSKDSYMALCPLHDNTNTPAMSIRDLPGGGVWKCFAGCGGGTIIDFWLIQHEYDPKDRSNISKVLEGLSAELNVKLPEWKPAETFSQQRIARALSEVAEKACDYLFSDDGTQALDYALDRGLTEQEIERSLMGFLPESNNASLALIKRATKDLDALVEAKFLRKNDDGGYWVPMYGRLLTPITNPRLPKDNRVIGFGARVIPDVECHGPDRKWINSPDSDVYHKQRVLYNLGDGVTAEDEVVVTEGYFDALAVDRTGFTGVAVCGTALTEHHIRLLEDAKSVTLVFDGDDAGKKALIRHLWALNKRSDLECGIVEGGEDPFDAILADNRTHPWSTQPLLSGIVKTQWENLGEKPESFDKWVAEALGLLTFSQHRNDLVAQAASLRGSTAHSYSRTLSYAKITQTHAHSDAQRRESLDLRASDIVRYLLSTGAVIAEAIYAPFADREDLLLDVIERYLPAGDREAERNLYLRVLNPHTPASGDTDATLAALLADAESNQFPVRAIQSILTAMQGDIRSRGSSDQSLLYAARAVRRLSSMVDEKMDSAVVATFDSALALARSA